MIRVRAPSRLHFGLLSLSSGEPWSNVLGEPTLPARRFGGVGLMIAEPGIQLTAQPAADWSADGVLAERALDFARTLAGQLPAGRLQPHRLTIEHAAPEHLGLGTGTQLGLAVVRALGSAGGLPEEDVVQLASYVGRGRRSAVGIHGFGQGGFLVEAGRRDDSTIAPLVGRWAFPEDWRVVVVLPPWGTGCHGEQEKAAFAQIRRQPLPLEATERLCRLVLLGLMPALVEHDFDGFSEALYDFNRRAGEAFRAAQGGPYASRDVGELVAFVRRQGVRGVGQSSWGPAVFAVTAEAAQATALAKSLRAYPALGAGQVIMTGACNRGAVVEANAP